jgi:RimJ/RimL family protein N-acetyltransferase
MRGGVERGARLTEGGPRVVLREVRGEDLPAFFEHQRDPVAAAVAGFPSRDRDAFTAHWERILRDPAVRARTVIADGRVAGNLVSFPLEGRRFVGYWLGRGSWGRGIATAALRRFLREEPTRPLFASVARSNVGSIRVLEKCGFRLAGTEPAGGGPDALLYELPGGEDGAHA